ncbi:MAG: aldo/keto reductase [Promethearchaeota archaeon]
MKYRKMGKITDKVSALGFGAMRMPSSRTESINMIRYAIDNGVNYVDTAFMYHGGQSEVIVGKALLDGYREKVTLTTKSPLMMVKTREDFDKRLNKQLRRLKVNPDIYLFHGMNKNRLEKVKSLNLIEKMEEAKAEGKFKYIGFSFHDSFDSFKEIIDFYDWDCCQIQHNYIDVEFQAGTKGLKYAASKDIPVIIMEPIRGGQLVIPEDKLDTKPEIKNVLDQSPVKRSMPDWALQFLWNQPEVSVVLSGMSTMQQVIENVESANNSGINTLTKEELETISALREAFKKYFVVPCTNCGYCMPCPNGVNIPTINRLVNEAAFWGTAQNPLVLYFYGGLAKTQEELEQKRAAGDEAEGAQTLCIQCGECVEKCPQEINIPDIMEKANLIFKDGKEISDVLS